MGVVIDSIVSFFVEKGADRFLSGAKDTQRSENLRQKIDAYARNYYETVFYQIPLSQEFDYGGLNDYLYDHLDGALAACFNAHDSTQRKYFQENLLRNAYEHAQAKSREQQNTVHTYVKGVLAIIEVFFTEQVEGKDWFLAGRIVEDVQEQTAQLLSEYSLQIKEYIQYCGSFADAVDSVVHHFDTDNEYHYLRKDIYFQGREDDLDYLDRFLAAPEDLLFAVVTGQGGLGKSKLMYHYMRRETGRLDWKIIFPSQKQIELFAQQYTEWSYPKNLLIVIDYVGEVSEAVGQWLNLLNHTQKRPDKMRIVMLERQGIVRDANETKAYPHWYLEIKKAAGHNFDKLLYQQDFYSLAPLGSEDLFRLMDNIAANQGKNLSQADKKTILNHAKEMGGPPKKDRFTTPLMIILLTDAFLDNKSLHKLSANKLMEYIIDKHRSHWRKTICNDDEDRFNSLELHLAYATAVGGWNLKPLPEPFANASALLLNSYSKTGLRLILSGVSESANQERILRPLEPDLVGEYFVMWFLSESTAKTYYNDLVSLFWHSPEFSYFLYRCVDSYLCDGEFDLLVDGEYSLLGDWGPVRMRSFLMGFLSSRLPLERRTKIVDQLAILARDGRYNENPEIVLEYARGLVGLSFEQDAIERAVTVERLATLAQDELYSENQNAVLAYAQGLVNLSLKQDVTERAVTVARLAALAQDKRRATLTQDEDILDILLAYAQGLVNYGLAKYKSGEHEDAGDTFLRSFELGYQTAGISLAYMVRRHEYNVSDFSIEKLLKEKLSQGNGFAIVNHALYLGINKGKWTDADRLLGTLSKEAAQDVVPWWTDIYQQGDPEGLLVLIWLLRHRIISAIFLSHPHKYYNQLREAYHSIPAWIVKRK